MRDLVCLVADNLCGAYADLVVNSFSGPLSATCHYWGRGRGRAAATMTHGL